MILLIGTIAVFSFIGIYFLSDMGYEVNIRKVESDQSGVQGQVSSQPLSKPVVPAQPVFQVPQKPNHTINSPVAKGQVNAQPDLQKHLQELHSIQLEMTQLNGRDGKINIAKLEGAIDKFASLGERAPELGIGKVINAGKLKELVGSLRGMEKLQVEIQEISKDPEHIDMEKMSAKLAELQSLQAEMMKTLPYIRPNLPYAQ